MNQYDNTVYCKEPLGEYQGVPFFSIVDDYISNYEKIAHDHVTKATEKRSNPFTEESLLIELEESTVLLVKKYISAGDSILDVGVGLGRLLSRFDNVSKYGMDISWNYLLAAKNHGINVCFSLIEDIPYKEEYFDIIICTDVLEHVIDLNLAILNILKVLKPDGYLIIRVPYREDLSMYLDRNYPYHYAHLRNFDEYSLELLFTRAFKNCEIVEFKTIGCVESISRVKCILPFPSYQKIITGLFYRLKNINKLLYRKLLPMFFHPMEINMVVRKKVLTKSN